MNDVFFKYDSIPDTAHPLAVTVEDRLLSLAADNNLRRVGADYTRTYLRLYNKLNQPEVEILLDTNENTLCIFHQRLGLFNNKQWLDYCNTVDFYAYHMI